MELHMPNGMMFTIGTKSMMFAAGMLPDKTRFSGSDDERRRRHAEAAHATWRH